MKEKKDYRVQLRAYPNRKFDEIYDYYIEYRIHPDEDMPWYKRWFNRWKNIDQCVWDNCYELTTRDFSFEYYKRQFKTISDIREYEQAQYRKCKWRREKEAEEYKKRNQIFY